MLIENVHHLTEFLIIQLCITFEVFAFHVRGAALGVENSLVGLGSCQMCAGFVVCGLRLILGKRGLCLCLREFGLLCLLS